MPSLDVYALPAAFGIRRGHFPPARFEYTIALVEKKRRTSKKADRTETMSLLRSVNPRASIEHSPFQDAATARSHWRRM
jgi:hypothetical protein